jgi:hypothetical protein
MSLSLEDDVDAPSSLKLQFFGNVHNDDVSWSKTSTL